MQWTQLREMLAGGVYPIAVLNLFPLNVLWVTHAVVIASIGDETVAYLDPIYGRRVVPLAAFDQAWTMKQRRAIVVRRQE